MQIWSLRNFDNLVLKFTMKRAVKTSQIQNMSGRECRFYHINGPKYIERNFNSQSNASYNPNLRKKLEVCFPGLVFGYQIFSRKIWEISRPEHSETSSSRSQLSHAHSRLATSRPVSVLKMKREFLNLKFCISIPEIPEFEYRSGIFLLSTENSNT